VTCAVLYPKPRLGASPKGNGRVGTYLFGRTGLQGAKRRKTRFICPDVAAVDVHWEMTGAMDAQGNPRPDRQGLLNFVMAKNAGEWQILVMHDLDLTALPPSNPGNSATKNP
jgi:hypothetical protein